MSIIITPSPSAIRAAQEIGQTCVIADGDHDPFVFFEYEECAVIIERELAAAQAKIANQSERIRYLEGATNHATGTPLSQAHAKIAALEAQLEAHAWKDIGDDEPRELSTPPTQ
jgi:hypothetical protein